jgi:hypothetical protein
VNGEANAIGLGDHQALAGLRADELLHFCFARIDLGNHSRDGLRIDRILEREESLLIKRSRLLFGDSPKRPNDRLPLKTAIERMQRRCVLMPDGHYYLPAGSVDSATISMRSRTRIESSSERDFSASSIIVMQKGHPTASVFGLATLS